ncbi:YfgM family protein [Aliidiomarina maris]|uniref:Ancillary SecYEG translocon subunit n=1 Tax=Aliidiomarina maris TaxID=531312 RepID=A0A327X3F9_9GAMM|nr:tetratricopeptide repeat protein [Aliidiomarina maris]MCL5051296.1 tetratricopeptide repeat protein [Bacillota bacterium]RAK00670.1 putative negative regulator of RcsB-dependent stress response [Aliidiomarina maris]
MEHEDQQVEQIKQFLREYGIWIGAGVVIGLGSLFGWRAYQGAQVEAAQSRTAVYQQLATQVQDGDVDGAEQMLAELGGSHVVVARLQVAQQAIQAGDLERAASLLQQAQQDSDEPVLRAVATTRLARVYLALGQHDQALQALNQRLPESFKAQVEEVRGDVYLAQGNAAQARQAYQTAVDLGGAQTSPALQMKFENLAGES